MDKVEEIRRLLDERGIEYEIDDSNYTVVFSIDYCEHCGDFLSRITVTGECVAAERAYLSPELAVDIAKPKTTTRDGKWVRRHYRDVPLCECCGQAIGDERYNYCPKCGARIVS